MTPNEPQEPLKTLQKGILNFTSLIACGVGIAVLSGILLWYGIKWDIAQCYKHDPWEFKAQTKLIKPGMSEQEALSLIKNGDEIKRDGNEARIYLKPVRSGYFASGIMIWIVLTLDDENNVVSCTWADG